MAIKEGCAPAGRCVAPVVGVVRDDRTSLHFRTLKMQPMSFCGIGFLFVRIIFSRFA